ncbi:hypothetical protein J2S03_002650 [Alicyclobacillus cycloheptanicus]|uniref:Sporulation protein YjcZ n=1 Tax=Alicyclobacillus cycloheptanicus TaxID=1457 RepID=A0ABT9XKI0_9BACL|nr:hypothetical protein [Alicyclobacillus cycloheptanicus]
MPATFGVFTRWVVVFLIIYVLMILLMPYPGASGDGR